MTDPKFTPGPWKIVGKNTDEVLIVTGYDVPGFNGAVPNDWVVGSSEWTFVRDTDIHLIGAAPEMYAMLDWIVNNPGIRYHEMRSRWMRLREKINEERP